MYKMTSLIKYIVCFILTFNITAINAADVTLDLEDNNDPQYISSEFKGVLNIPHSIAFKEMLDSPMYSSEKTSPSAKIAMIGFYFDVKYPGDAIEYDFSDDVAIIFPDLNSKEVVNRTSFIRTVVKAYRWGKEKYSQYIATKVAPKDPPLIVDDDEYALLGTVDYIPVPKGSFAVINDFKKVVSYSSDKKDVEAMEAFRLRQLENKENKTDNEKFISMINKLEFSKIPSYGIDLPNPFIGNVGIGKWIEKGPYKFRAVSEIAQIYNAESFIAGLHVSVPNHRFMLANNISETLRKPQIELLNTQNIKSYDVFYPLSVPFADEKMIHAYSADFIFPIKIETINPKEAVSFDAKITYNDCDLALNCLPDEIIIPLTIETGPDNMSSAIKNFIKQGYYSIPSGESEYLDIEKIYANTSTNKEFVDSISMVVSFEKTPKDFSILLENRKNTQFSSPKVTLNNDKMYVTIVPLSDNDTLLDYPLTITIKLNNYSYIRRTISLTSYSKTETQNSNTLDLLIIAFLSGILFYITPAGLMLLLFGICSIASKSRNENIRFWITSAVSIVVFQYLLYIVLYFNTAILWGSQFNNIFCLALASLTVMMIVLSAKYQQKKLSS